MTGHKEFQGKSNARYSGKMPWYCIPCKGEWKSSRGLANHECPGEPVAIKKGDIVILAVRGRGENGDFMFMKGRFRLFLKNKSNKPIPLSAMIKLKIVKLFDKVGYVELV